MHLSGITNTFYAYVIQGSFITRFLCKHQVKHVFCKLEVLCSFVTKIQLFYSPQFFHQLTLLVSQTNKYTFVPSHYQLLWTVQHLLAVGYEQGNSN